MVPLMNIVPIDWKTTKYFLGLLNATENKIFNFVGLWFILLTPNFVVKLPSFCEFLTWLYFLRLVEKLFWKNVL